MEALCCSHALLQRPSGTTVITAIHTHRPGSPPAACLGSTCALLAGKRLLHGLGLCSVLLL